MEKFDQYLQILVEHSRKKVEEKSTMLDKLQMYAGALLQWTSYAINDKNYEWRMAEDFLIDDLYLTGTNPEWNKIIIDTCQRSPQKFRIWLKNNRAELFDGVIYSDIPIWVREEDGKYQIFDGMHRVIGAMIEGKDRINVIIGKLSRIPNPTCEPHVVYDLLVPFARGYNRDFQGLKSALMYLKKSYSNVDYLLKYRFNADWEKDVEMQQIIKEVLAS